MSKDSKRRTPAVRNNRGDAALAYMFCVLYMSLIVLGVIYG
jgi:hypothetical protein